MSRRTDIENSIVRGAAMMKAASAIKSSSLPVEPIVEVPGIGGHYANHSLEKDYEMKHPFISTFHPGVYGGLALGVLGNRLIAKSQNDMLAALAGGVAGNMVEAAHRYGFLENARAKLEAGESPIDKRYVF